MFERFTDSGRRVIVEAAEEARRLGHHHLAGLHLVIAYAQAEGPGPLGLDAEELRRVAAQRIPATASVGAHQPFEPQAKKGLEMALRVAVKSKSDEITALLVLAGVLAAHDPLVDEVLGRDPGAGVDDIIAELGLPVQEPKRAAGAPMPRTAASVMGADPVAELASEVAALRGEVAALRAMVERLMHEPGSR